MKNKKLIIKVFSVLVVLAAVAAIGFSSLMLQGCGGDDGECLVYGENCSQQYLLDNYGTTDIYCCEGTCADHGSGYLVCR